MKLNSYQIIIFQILVSILYPNLSFAQDNDLDIDQFRKTVKIDTVSKILNYTEGLDENGSDNSFWYAYDSKACIYRKVGFIEVKLDTPKIPDQSLSGDEVQLNQILAASKTQWVLNPNIRELKLNTWAPSTVRVGYVQHIGTWWGPNNYFIQVMANGNLVLESTKPRDIDRTKAAWDAVFNKFCPGIRNYF
jgi:hypothetical protein